MSGQPDGCGPFVNVSPWGFENGEFHSASEQDYVAPSKPRVLDVSAAKSDSFSSRTVGFKGDSGKPRPSLLPPKALMEVVKVLEVGAETYGAENWRHVEDGKKRYFDALLRHTIAHWSGEEKDPKDGLSHMAHIACNALFLLEL